MTASQHQSNSSERPRLSRDDRPPGDSAPRDRGLPEPEEVVSHIVAIFDAAGVPAARGASLLRAAAAELERQARDLRHLCPLPRPATPLSAEALEPVPEELIVGVLAGDVDLEIAAERGGRAASATTAKGRRAILFPESHSRRESSEV